MSDHYESDDEQDRVEAARVLSRAMGVIPNPTERIDHPAHYGGAENPHEPIKVVEHYGLGFCLGNAIKYILRAPHKGAHLEDLKKARWYLDREIARMEGEKS